METITPQDATEAVAIGRMQVLGALARRQLRRGELRAELHKLSQQAFLMPGESRRRRLSVTTLERWHYALRKHGLSGLRPKQRDDRGRARALSPEQKALLLDIRSEFPQAAVTLILATLIRDGRLDAGCISAATVRRFFAQEGVQRAMAAQSARPARQRWQAERPGMLWHADVCHGPALNIDGRSRPLRIHALLDDASRYIVALRVAHTERESDMLALLVQAWRSFGTSDLLYLDNGATYRGDAMAIACARLGTTVLHAKPYDPQARGKMERFWRTLRQGCLNYLALNCSLHDAHVKITAFVGQIYNNGAHAALMGETPAVRWAQRQTSDTSEAAMRDALTVRTTRTVGRDGTVGVGGVLWEAEQGFLAGRKVTVARTLLDCNDAPWVEYAERRYPLRRTDPIANGKRKRAHVPKRTTGVDVLFDPMAHLEKSTGGTP